EDVGAVAKRFSMQEYFPGMGRDAGKPVRDANAGGWAWAGGNGGIEHGKAHDDIGIDLLAAGKPGILRGDPTCFAGAIDSDFEPLAVIAAAQDDKVSGAIQKFHNFASSAGRRSQSNAAAIFAKAGEEGRQGRGAWPWCIGWFRS